MWFIIRHGETLHNVKRMVQGHCQSLLTLKGINQIKSVGYRLQNTNEDFKNYKLITSPMIRTRNTTQILQEILGLTNVKYIEEDLIAEVDTGLATNMTEDEAKEKYSSFWNVNCYLDRKYPNGESNNQVYDRVLKFFDKYKNEKNLIIITHSGITRCFRNHILGRKREEIDLVLSNQNYFLAWDGNKLEIL